jgi:hypothetical protein
MNSMLIIEEMILNLTNSKKGLYPAERLMLKALVALALSRRPQLILESVCRAILRASTRKKTI